MDAIDQVRSSLAAGNHILYEDECDINVLRVMKSMWMQRGKQLRIPTPSTDGKGSVFGALDICTGGLSHLIFDRK